MLVLKSQALLSCQGLVGGLVVYVLDSSGMFVIGEEDFLPSLPMYLVEGQRIGL